MTESVTVAFKRLKMATKWNALSVKKAFVCPAIQSGITDARSVGLQRSTYVFAICHTFYPAKIEDVSARHPVQTKLYHTGKCTSENATLVDATFVLYTLLPT